MARVLKETTEIIFGPLTNVLMGMILLAIYILMDCKVTSGRRWGKKFGERSSRVGSTKKKNEEKLRVTTHSQNPTMSHRRNYLQDRVMTNQGGKG